MAGQQGLHLSTERQIEEFNLCEDGLAGFIYWCETYARIEDKDTHRAIVFKLYACQKRIIKQVFNGRWLRILKARRLGVTWLFAAYAVWLMTFREMQTVGYLIHKKEYSEDFVNRCDFIASRMPAWLRPVTTSQNRKSMDYKDNESWIRGLTATKGAADSVAADVVIVDEATKIEEKQAGLLNSILQSIEPTVETAKGTIVLIAKSEGPQGLFYKGWKASEKGTDKYANVFLSWRARPGRTKEWYANEVAMHTADPLFMPRNYPATADEAFQQAEGRVYPTFHLATHVGRVLPDGNLVGETDQPLWVPDHWPKWRAVDWGGREPFVCYDDKTEVLTVNGFQLFKDVGMNEPVATYNMETGGLEWQLATEKIVQRYRGPMIQCEPRVESVNFCVTPNHKMVIRSAKGGKPRLCDADKMPTGTVILVGWNAQSDAEDHDLQFHVPPAGMNKTAKNLPPVTREQFCRFLGWLLSEGCLTGGKYVRISQKTRTEELGRLLKDEMGWLGSRYKDKNGVTVFSIGNVSLVRFLQSCCGTGKSQTKRIPRFVLAWGNRCLQALLDGLVAGDGTRREIPQYLYVFRSTSRGLTDDVQEIACRLGLATTLTWQKAQSGYKKETHGYWQVQFCRAQQSSVQKLKEKIERVEYDAMIYCLTVPNQTLIVRRGNRPMVCGNCLWISRISKEGVRLTVDPACEKTIGEFMAYRYKPHTDYFEDKNNHACFAAGTMIETQYGPRPIEFIAQGDVVRSHLGYTKVLAVKCTGTRPLVRMEFSSGQSWRRWFAVTPDHPIAVHDGGFLPFGLMNVNRSVVMMGPPKDTVNPDGFDHDVAIQESFDREREAFDGPEMNAHTQRIKPRRWVKKAAIIGVLPIREAPVWNLATGDGTYFANGVLVSNCDALRYCIETMSLIKGHYHIYRELYLPNTADQGLELSDLSAMIRDMTGDEQISMTVADRSQPLSINAFQLHKIPCMANQHYLKEGSTRRGLITQGVRMVNTLLVGTGEFLPARVRATPSPEDAVTRPPSRVSVSLDEARLLRKKASKQRSRTVDRSRQRRMTVANRRRGWR